MLHLAELKSNYQPHSTQGFKILYSLIVNHKKETFSEQNAEQLHA
jgi:hypothetical protein